MSEFDVIATYFTPLTMGKAALDNDTARVQVPKGFELAVTTDSLNEGVHFFSNTSPEVIARKALRSNLSDLASSGAEPLCYQLAIAFPHEPEAVWLKAFTDALLVDQSIAGVYCSGGDTTFSKAGLCITITALGLVPEGANVGRSGAQVGDVAIVTGVIGAGYAAYKREETMAPPLQFKISSLVREYARAAIDISDGLLADAKHIAQASGVDLVLRAEDIPVEGALLEAVTGGDDYALLLAVPAEQMMACLSALGQLGYAPAVVGEFRPGGGRVALLDAAGTDITPEKAGWVHF